MVKINKICEICLKNYIAYYIEQKFCSRVCMGKYLSKINMGKKLSDETKQKIREVNMGKKLSDEIKRKISESNKGKKRSDEAILKYSLSKLGDRNPMYKKDFSIKHRQNLSVALTGRVLSEESRKKISLAHIGVKMSNKGHLSLAQLNYHLRQRGRKETPEQIERKKIVLQIAMKRPEVRAKISKGNKGKVRTAEHRRNTSNIVKELFKNNPLYREKIKLARMKQVIPVRDTSIEVKIQNYLKELNIEFFTHQYMHIEHGYQCDIFIPSMNMVIECDGDYWHHYPTRSDIDNIRTKELIEKGFKVLRLWEREINVMSLEEFKIKIEVLDV